MATFIGGPLDTFSFTAEEINRVGHWRTARSESGFRNFLMMPSPADCTRILQGESSEITYQEPLCAYEEFPNGDGEVEYHEATRALAHAHRQAPLTGEQVELKSTLASIADRFEKSLQSISATENVQVFLIPILRDRRGTIHSGSPILILDQSEPVGSDPIKSLLTAALRDPKGHINSLVRQAHTDFVTEPSYPDGGLQIFDFVLRILKPESEETVLGRPPEPTKGKAC